MKVYTDFNTEGEDSAEILLNHQELKSLVKNLTNFEKEIEEFKARNKEKENVGFTHLHLKDCGITSEGGRADLVFYVDLDAK